MTPTAPAPARRRGGTRAVRLLAVWLGLQLLVSLGAVVLLAPPADAPTRDAPVRAGEQVRAAPAPDPRAQRAEAVRALLDARAAALLARDRAGFLAGIWAGDPAFVERQAALFDNLAAVPLSVWKYELDGRTDRFNAELDARYGEGQWWTPEVVLTYAIAEFDPEPTYAPQRLTFVRTGDTWLIASDTDLEPVGLASARGLWDFAPVVVVRGERTLVLGHPGSERLLRRVADGIDAAVPRVSRVWGTDWAEQVVALVPDDTDELDRMLGGTTDLTRIAAVATAEVTDRNGGYHPVGSRVIVNPPNFAKLGRLGRQVVLTHETAHVASRVATGPDVPTWLVEGLADYISYLDADVPLSVAARDTATAVADGWRPERLPTNNDFSGSNPELQRAYESSWMAFRLIVETYGEQPALAFYRAVGASRTDGAEAAVERAFAAELGTTSAVFTALWRDHLVSAFS